MRYPGKTNRTFLALVSALAVVVPAPGSNTVKFTKHTGHAPIATCNGCVFGIIHFHPWQSAIQTRDLSVVRRAGGLPASPEPRHYTIPTIDLSQETERRIIVDREPGQYLGHPSTVLLGDNRRIIAVYPKGHGRGGIVMKKSSDSGLTWSERLAVPDNWATSKETPTLFRVTDPHGVERLILFSGLYPIRMAISDDNGVTWTPLKPIGDFGGIVAMSSLVRLRDGTHMAVFHDDGRFLRNQGRPSSFKVYKTLSTDGGLTWSEPEVVTEHPIAHLCEPGVVRSPDGEQLAVLMRENSRQFNSMVIFSDDQGKTWSDPVELPASLTGDRHVARYAPDGRLVVVFQDTTHVSPTKGDFVAWIGAYDDIIHGRQGQYRVRLLDNKKGADTGYAGLELLPDGTFVATAYCHLEEDEPPLIASVRFQLEEIDARAKLPPHQTELWVSGKGGYHTYRIPSLIVTKGGTLLAFCEGRKNSRRDTGDIDLLVKRSTDGGRTWSGQQVVCDDGPNTCGNPCPVVAQDTATTWLLMTHNLGVDSESKIISGTSKGTRTVWITSSTDDGLTWAEPVEITSAVKKPDWTWYATGPGVGIQLRHPPHKGRLVIPCDHKTRGDKIGYHSHVFYSDDHGKTWTLGGSTEDGVNESQVIERADGSLLLNMRRSATNPAICRAIATSTDGGVTWSKLSYDKALISPRCQASLVRYRGYEATATPIVLFSNPADTTQRLKMTVRLSYDDGRTWPVAKLLHAGPSAYSCLTVLPDGSIACLYERGDKHPYETITFARFNLDWLAEGQGPVEWSSPCAKIRIGPYPGGYPRVTSDELCVDPRPDHKLAVYLPWENSGYIVVDLPEVIFSNLGVLFLAHKHIPTIWTEKNVELETVSWERLEDGSMKYARRLPNKVAFGARAIPGEDSVEMELFLENGTVRKLTGLRTQVCVLLKEAKGFNQLTNDNKFFAPGEPSEEPLVAVGDEERKRWIATAWDHGVMKWGRHLCPCIHSDPQFPDCPPGERVVVRGKIFFFEGDIEENYQRVKKEGRLFWKP